jgi:hypothetical protein
MKKFWLSLGLGLMLACWCGGGYYGLGTCPAFAQYYGYRGQNYDSRHLSCDPRDPSCYRDYHAAPYADPFSQLLYYIAPPVERNQHYDTHQHYQHQEGNRGGQEGNHGSQGGGHGEHEGQHH